MGKETVDFEDMFAEEDMDNFFTTMTTLIKDQQEIALGLTQLIVESAQEESFTKQDIFQTYEEAMAILKRQLEMNN